LCWRLKKCMCGTLPAAAGWQKKVADVYEAMDMVGCKTTPCAFPHRTRGLVSAVHGDGFITAGPEQDIDWFGKEMALHLEIVCKARLGLEPGCSTEGKILNRLVRVDQNGFSCEADPRHAELATQELGLTTARPQLSPGGAKAQDGDEVLELDTEATSAYRTVTARLYYLASDRPELLFATKECGKSIDSLKLGGLDALEEDGALLAEGAAVRLAFPLAGRDLCAGGLLGCGRWRLRQDEALYFRWSIATWRTHAVRMVVEPEYRGLELV
jgi:hypothetical protein